MAQFAAFAQHTWPHRVLKIIQGANCPVVAPSGVLLSRAGPQVSHRKMVLGSNSEGKGWGKSHLHTQPGGQGRRGEVSWSKEQCLGYAAKTAPARA